MARRVQSQCWALHKNNTNLRQVAQTVWTVALPPTRRSLGCFATHQTCAHCTWPGRITAQSAAWFMFMWEVLDPLVCMWPLPIIFLWTISLFFFLQVILKELFEAGTLGLGPGKWQPRTGSCIVQKLKILAHISNFPVEVFPPSVSFCESHKQPASLYLSRNYYWPLSVPKQDQEENRKWWALLLK